MARKLLIVDLEATCWKDEPSLAAESEIIEIGAVVFDPDSTTVEQQLQTFVRPVRHPLLSDFCTQLTTIRQTDIDSAPVFPMALALLVDCCLGRSPVLFSSWGDYDRNQLERDCAFHGVKYPFGKRHFNIKAHFAATKRCRPCSLGQALAMLHMSFDGSPHRGIDDARNIARVLTKLP